MASTSNGQFVWHEHMTQDVQKAIAFYSDVVGWTTQPFPENPDYVMWVASQGPLGGVMKLPEEVAKMGIPPHWMGHVQVADVDATAELAKKLGGNVHKEPMDIPTVGRFAILADPQGAAFSVFKPNGEMTAHDSSKAGEICWNELLTSDSEAALAFYGQLFGWKQIDAMDMGPMGTYRTFGLTEDKRFGGVMNVPPGAPMPPAWLYYAETKDLDAAIARATKAGATIMHGPMDVPGGRVVSLMDPQGAAFALHHYLGNPQQ